MKCPFEVCFILQARLIALMLWLTDLPYLRITVMEELDEL